MRVCASVRVSVCASVSVSVCECVCVHVHMCQCVCEVILLGQWLKVVGLRIAYNI